MAAASDSSVLCHSIVAVSSVWHGAYRGNQAPDVRNLALHGQALAALRKVLNGSLTTHSDATILAATTLTHQLVLSRNRSGLKTHINGVKALVDARGG